MWGEGGGLPVGDGIVVFVNEIRPQGHGQGTDGHDLGAWEKGGEGERVGVVRRGVGAGRVR